VKKLNGCVTFSNETTEKLAQTDKQPINHAGMNIVCVVPEATRKDNKIAGICKAWLMKALEKIAQTL